MLSAANKPALVPWSPGRALALVACTPILPQILGSIFNIWYNLVVIGPLLNTEHLKQRFDLTVIVFNAVVYPLAMGGWIWLVASLLPALKQAVAQNAATSTPLL